MHYALQNKDGQFMGVFYPELPPFHWLGPNKKIALTPVNAAGYGYVPADQHSHAYAVWLLQSGAQLQVINDAYELAVERMVSHTPKSERDSWDEQKFEAQAYDADSSVATPYVDGLAAARGVERDWLLARILYKVGLYSAAHSTLTGRRQALEDQLALLDVEDGSLTHDQVLAVKWVDE